MLFKKSHNMHKIFFLVCSTPGPMSSLDTVSKFTVSQWDHTSSMVGYHDHVSTASSQRDCVSQSTLSPRLHDNLVNRCGCRSSSHSSPLSASTAVGNQRRSCLLKQDMSAGEDANCCSGRLSIGNLQGHTPRVFFWVPSRASSQLTDKHISDSSQIFASCSCWRTRLF